MVEPYLYVFDGMLDKPLYSELAPVEFKNPQKMLSLMPMTSRILTLGREPFTVDEIEKDSSILKQSYENTTKNKLRKNTDNDFISIRSNETEIPCAAGFLIPSRQKLFTALNIDINDYYIVFITPDEVLLADKQKFKPTQIRKVTANIKNKMNSLFTADSPILCTEVFIYDSEADKYVEI